MRVHDAVQVCLQHVQNSSSALNLALQDSGEQDSGDSAHNISTPMAKQQRLKQDSFFMNLWKAQDGKLDSGGEGQPLLRQNLV